MKPPLVFVHGFACDRTDWRAQVDSLGSRTTVVEHELPGHGSTPGTPADCTIGAYGAGPAGMLAELELPPAILVGHSMGCRVVLEANRFQPEASRGVPEPLQVRHQPRGSRSRLGETLEETVMVVDDSGQDLVRTVTLRMADFGSLAERHL